MDIATALASSNAIGETPEVDREMRRLQKAAEQFEAVMLATLLKEARVMSPGGGLGGSEQGSAGRSALSDFGSQALSSALAQGGGFGIAEVLVRTMAPQVKALAAHHDTGGRAG